MPQPPVQTLLLVDDEPNILSALQRLFRRDGYVILATPSTEEALTLLSTQAVDVILSDQRMPGMNGVEFLRRVKALHPETIRIVLSGYTDLQFITDAINEGSIYKFLTKPWDDDQLREQVAEAFQRKRITDDNLRLNTALQAANIELKLHAADKERQARRIETVLDTLQEVLQLIPWPIVGIDEDNMIALSNAAADSLLGDSAAPLLEHDARQALPASLHAGLQNEADMPLHLQHAGHQFRVIYKHMGQHSRSRGALLALLPCEEQP